MTLFQIPHPERASETMLLQAPDEYRHDSSEQIIRLACEVERLKSGGSITKESLLKRLAITRIVEPQVTELPDVW